LGRSWTIGTSENRGTDSHANPVSRRIDSCRLPCLGL
jgi:hypothetical protein